MFCLLSNIGAGGGLEFSWNGKIMALVWAHKGQKSIGIFSPHLVVHLTFFPTWFQIFKSKLLSLRNQGLCSIPWTLNKWWSKVKKWWGFPAVCLITPHLPTSAGPQSLRPFAKGVLQVPARVPPVMLFLTGQSLRKESMKRWRRKVGRGEPKSPVEQRCFIHGRVFIYCNTRRLYAKNKVKTP